MEEILTINTTILVVSILGFRNLNKELHSSFVTDHTCFKCKGSLHFSESSTGEEFMKDYQNTHDTRDHP